MVSRNVYKTKLLALVGYKGNMFFDYFGVECDWCAMFVAYANRALANNLQFPKLASCTAIKSAYKLRVNHEFNTAEIGDLVLFELNNNRNDGVEHIGIVINNNKDNGTITLIEGNTGSSNFRTSTVGTFTYPYNSSKFDCIIDMSSDFADDDELEHLKSQIERIKEIVNE